MTWILQHKLFEEKRGFKLGKQTQEAKDGLKKQTQTHLS